MADISTTFDNIAGYWELDETSGTRVDSSTNGNDLTDNNTVGSATTAVGVGADFELSNSEYLNRSSSFSSLQFTTDFSIGLWFTLETLPSVSGASFALVSRDRVTNRSYLLEINNATNKLRMLFFDSSGALTRVECDTTLSTSTLYSLVVSNDISAGASGINFYINGSATTTTTLNNSTTTLNAGSSPFSIGARDKSSSRDFYFDGIIQKTLITSDIITAGEASTFYNGGAGLVWEEAGGAPFRNSNVFATL